MRLEIDLRASRVVGAAVIVAAPSRKLKLSGLTNRQREVAASILAGRSNKAIAHELGIQLSTVKDHVQAIYRALGVGTRTQAVLAVSQMSRTRS